MSRIPERALPHRVTLIPRVEGVEDEFGNPQTSDGTPVPDVKARMSRRSATEVTVDRSAESSEWNLMLLPSETIDASYVVEWNGERYEVAEPPYLVYGSSEPHHIEALLIWRRQS